MSLLQPPAYPAILPRCPEKTQPGLQKYILKLIKKTHIHHALLVI